MSIEPEDILDDAAQTILELELAETEFDAMLMSDTDDAVDRLTVYHEILQSVPDISKIQHIFKNDATFVSLFGEDPEQWNANISDFLKNRNTSVDTEGMKLQDFLRWGPFGVVIGLYLKSLGRVARRLEGSIKDLEKGENLVKKHSIYLPDYDKASKLIDGLKAFQDLLIKVVSDPKSASVEEMSNALRKLGIDTGKNPETSTDWKAVGGAMLGRVLFAGLPILGNAVMSHLVSDKGARLEKRGWTNEKLLAAMRKMLEVVKQANKFNDAVKRANSAQVDEENGDELKKVAKMVKGAFKAYRQLVALLGRGLAAI